MSQPTRASGLPTGVEVARDLARADEVAEDPTPAPETKRSKFRTPGFSRMRFDWRGDDAPVVEVAKDEANKRILIRFQDAFAILHDVLLVVREPVRDPETGFPQLDGNGWPVWQRTPSGGYVEDFTKLNHTAKENFLFAITTRLFAWEQDAADIWTEAMLAKAAWEEQFSIEYDAPQVGTIEDRTAKGRTMSTDERYFAIFQTALSRKADAIVRNMALLAQRLKDTLD
jgi:hypothetical protein